ATFSAVSRPVVRATFCFSINPQADPQSCCGICRRMANVYRGKMSRNAILIGNSVIVSEWARTMVKEGLGGHAGSRSDGGAEACTGGNGRHALARTAQGGGSHACKYASHHDQRSAEERDHRRPLFHRLGRPRRSEVRIFSAERGRWQPRTSCGLNEINE